MKRPKKPVFKRISQSALSVSLSHQLSRAAKTKQLLIKSKKFMNKIFTLLLCNTHNSQYKMVIPLAFTFLIPLTLARRELPRNLMELLSEKVRICATIPTLMALLVFLLASNSSRTELRSRQKCCQIFNSPQL